MNPSQRALFVRCIAVSVLLVACGCGKVTAPTSFGEYNSKDGVVKCKFPEGWTRNGGGADKFHSCAFESGPAKIRLLADVAGSAMGDIAGAGAGMGTVMPGEEIDEDLTPVAAVHEESLFSASQELGELDAKPAETIQTGYGDTRKSEFTVSGSFGGTTHGYLVTALGHDKRIRVIATCPDKHWKTLQPAFDEVISSIGPGQRQ